MVWVLVGSGPIPGLTGEAELRGLSDRSGLVSAFLLLPSSAARSLTPS